MSAITSITGLQNLTNLQQLYADWNSLTSVNVSGLANLVDLDLSDSEIPGVGTPSLTSVNLTGCTALEQLRLDDSNFSAGIPDLTGLNALTYFDMDQCNISGAVDISQLSTLTGFDLSSNVNITSVQLPEALLTDVNIRNNALTEAAVNNILQWLDGSQVSTNTAAPGNVGIAASTDFDIVGDFTIEMFVNQTNTDGYPRPYSFGAYPAPNAMSIEGGQLYFWANNNPLINGTFVPNLGSWYHVCVIGSGSTAYMFIDGSQVASSPYSGSISSQGLPLTIGFGNEPNSSFNGLMSNFRWTSGVVYNVNGFTVPTEPLPNISSTKLLIFQGTNLPMQLSDNSGNGHHATNSGATYSASNPFAGYEGSLQMGIV